MERVYGSLAMIFYEHYYVNGNGLPLDAPSTPTATNPANFKIPYVSVQYNAAGTQATLTIYSPVTAAGSYGGELASPSGFATPSKIVTTNTSSAVISGLTPGQSLLLRLRAYSGQNQTGEYGEYYYDWITPPKPTNVGSTTSTTTTTKIPPSSAGDRWWQEEKGSLAPNSKPNPLATTDKESSINVLNNQSQDRGVSYATVENRVIQTSLFKISVPDADKKVFSLATKNTNIATSSQYYTFGTSLFFQSDVNNVEGSGGIGFFTSNNGMNGYYVLIQTTSNLSSTADKEVKVIKVVNGKKTVLNDSQKGSTSKTLTGILGGISYKVDINVKTTSTSRVIDVYVNNFKITATDTTTNSSIPLETVLPITSEIAMFAATGTASFDYIYASPLTQDQYEEGIMGNVYEGKYGIKTLTFLYGDKIIGDKTISANQTAFLEEFGTVARELRRVKIKYEARPADPIFTSVGINKYVSVLGERLTSFGAEIYVINNAGTFVPLDDSNLYSFSVVGNYVVTTGQHEYVSNELSETTIAEPVIFESAWIQSEADAKNLTSWIETQWSKQQQIVEMSIFSNPLISVGDVITISHPKNGLDGTQKFVVTRVNNQFKEGLETSITARSIYS